MDITAGYRSVELMKQYVARTMNEHCIGGLGGFGGLFELDCTGYKHPVLISGTDGVGTKLKIAMILDKHDTIGIDCVAMCVNDVICAGAKPLVFLDYIACGRNIPEKIAEIVKGVAEGCVQADCSLVGGETAEHPGMMPEEEYDLAGFTVGVVDKEKILNNDTMKPGDVILALPSTGVHSNGFSLVRKIFDIDGNPDILKTAPAELGGKTLGEALLAPTRIYVKPVLKVLEEVDVKGISHITGGGFYENIPRSLKKGCCASIKKEDVRIPALFHLMQKVGGISEHDMFNTFNMGVGMVLTVPAAQADKALEILRSRLLAQKQKEQQDAINANRQGQVGTGDRSEKIRTYNFPQDRCTDHRIGLTVHNLDKIMDGNLDDVIDALATREQTEKLQKLNEQR